MNLVDLLPKAHLTAYILLDQSIALQEQRRQKSAITKQRNRNREEEQQNEHDNQEELTEDDLGYYRGRAEAVNSALEHDTDLNVDKNFVRSLIIYTACDDLQRLSLLQRMLRTNGPLATAFNHARSDPDHYDRDSERPTDGRRRASSPSCYVARPPLGNGLYRLNTSQGHRDGLEPQDGSRDARDSHNSEHEDDVEEHEAPRHKRKLSQVLDAGDEEEDELDSFNQRTNVDDHYDADGGHGDSGGGREDYGDDEYNDRSYGEDYSQREYYKVS